MLFDRKFILETLRINDESFVITFIGRVNCDKGIFQLIKYTLLTRRHLQLTFGRYDSETPDWSPNGKQIVFSAKKKKVSKLYYISAFGGRSIRVTTNANNITETNPVWSK